MLVAERALSHVCKLDRPLRTSVHEPIAALGVEFSGCDDLCELLHVCWFDVHNIKALVLDVQVPKVDSQIIAADVGLAVAVDRNAIYVVCMRIGVCPTRNGCHDRVVVS